jgi:DNA polymerase III gamma/tau subunit
LAERDEILAEISELAPLEILKAFTGAERLITEREAALALVISLGKLRPHEVLELAQALAKLSPEKIEFFIREAARWHRDLLVIATGQDQDEAPIFATDHREELRTESARWSAEQLAEGIAALERVPTAIHGNANVQLLLESLLLRLARWA